MASTLTPLQHIHVDDKGCAWVSGTSYKVLGLVLDHLAHGYSPEEIQYQHYGEPSLAQIHAAFAYYYDHQKELDAEIERQVRSIAELRAKSGESPVVKRLRAEGKLK